MELGHPEQNHPLGPVPSIFLLLLLMFLKLASEASQPLPVAQCLGRVPGAWLTYFLVASVQSLISEADSHQLVDIGINNSLQLLHRFVAFPMQEKANTLPFMCRWQSQNHT